MFSIFILASIKPGCHQLLVVFFFLHSRGIWQVSALHPNFDDSCPLITAFNLILGLQMSSRYSLPKFELYHFCTFIRLNFHLLCCPECNKSRFLLRSLGRIHVYRRGWERVAGILCFQLRDHSLPNTFSCFVSITMAIWPFVMTHINSNFGISIILEI